MPEIKLKPCPFCGGKAEICKDNYNNYLVSCCCGVIMGVELEDGCELVDGWRATFNTMEEAIEAWNRRIENDR